MSALAVGHRYGREDVVVRETARARQYGRDMDSLLYLALWSVPVLVGYFVIRLAWRHGVMDAHRRMQSGEISRPDRSSS